MGAGPGTVREAMHEGAECIGESKTLLDAAKRMAELDVGVLPICGDDDRLKQRELGLFVRLFRHLVF